MHLADTFIQSDLQCIQVIQYMCSLGIEPTTFCAADAMLYHWATQEHTQVEVVVVHVLFFAYYIVWKKAYSNTGLVLDRF